MKSKSIISILLTLIFTLVATVSVAANVQTELIWDDTFARSHSINKGETAGFMAIFESIDENRVQGWVDVLQDGRVIHNDIVTLDRDGRNNNYQFQGFVSPDLYPFSGTYLIHSSVHGSTSGITRSAQLQITIVNRAPVITPVVDKTVREGELLTFTVSANDPDGDTITFSSTNLPRGAHLDRSTGTFSWVPDYTQQGSYTVIITVSDNDTGSRSIPVIITVQDVAASADAVVFITPDQPRTADALQCNFNDDESGVVFSWLQAGREVSTSQSLDPSFTQKGQVWICEVAKDFGDPLGWFVYGTDSVRIRNTAPTLQPLADRVNNPESCVTNCGLIVGQEYTETAIAIDSDVADGTDAVHYTISDVSVGFAIDEVTGVMHFTAAAAHIGTTYIITVSATDNEAAVASTSFQLRVFPEGAENRAPVINDIENRRVTAGREVVFNVSATDPDNDSITLSLDSLPSDATFNPATGEFRWQTDVGDEGEYVITFTASDGSLEDEETVIIIVTEENNPPILNPIRNKAVNEGQTLSFIINAADPDNDLLRIGIKSHSLPGEQPRLEVVGENQVRFVWQAGFNDSGVYAATFEVTDGEFTDQEAITIFVRNVNRAPQFVPVGDKVGTEGVPMEFRINASDPDEDALRLGAEDLPSGAEFLDKGDGIGVFRWTPDFDQAGVYTVTFKVTDGFIVREIAVKITINNKNQAPNFETIGNKTVNEGELLTFTISATDPDGDVLSYGVKNLPPGAEFDATTRTFSWRPGFDQAGIYRVTFLVSDGHGGVDRERSIITVGNVNQPPRIVTDVDTVDMQEGEQVVLRINFDDIDVEDNLFVRVDSRGITPEQFASAVRVQEDPFLIIAPLLRGNARVVQATLSPDFDFVLHPESEEKFELIFRVSDREDFADPAAHITEKVVAVTVHDLNRHPELTPVGNKEINANTELSFRVSATDADSDSVRFSATNLPAGASFNTATGEFNWTPTPAQVGRHEITFAVGDGFNGTDQETIIITVLAAGAGVNHAPVLNPIGNKLAATGVALTFTVSASDPDGDILTYHTTGLPTGAHFDVATQIFTWSPDIDQIGTHQVTFIVSDGDLEDTETVTITVTEFNAVPVITSRPKDIAREGEEYQYDLIVSDDNAVTFILLEGPDGMTLNPNGHLRWTPPHKGRFQVRLAVTDGVFTVYQYFTIAVREVTAEARILSAHLTPEIVSAGEIASLGVTIDNNGGQDLENIRVTVLIPELAVKRSSGLFDLNSGEGEDREFAFEVPEFTAPGVYLVQVTLHNNHFHQTSYRELIVK